MSNLNRNWNLECKSIDFGSEIESSADFDLRICNRYKTTFDIVASDTMRHLEASKIMNEKVKRTNVSRVLAVAAAAILTVSCMCAAAYAADIGGIRSSISGWVISGGVTSVTIETEDSGAIAYFTEDGSLDGIVTFDTSELDLGEDGEVYYALDIPTVDFRDDGTVWASYGDETMDVTDMFEDGVCYVKLDDGNSEVYLTITEDGNYAFSCEGYPSAETIK